MPSPTENAIARIRQLRKRHGWTQQQLADRLNVLGAQTDRAVVAKVELGQRGLSLDEAFLYAIALDVAPVYLFVPIDRPGEPVTFGPSITCTPEQATDFIRGKEALPVQDRRSYFTERPEHEAMVLIAGKSSITAAGEVIPGGEEKS